MKTVATTGTFDLFHQGHKNLLDRLCEEYCKVVVFVYDNKEYKVTCDSLQQRMLNVSEYLDSKSVQFKVIAMAGGQNENKQLTLDEPLDAYCFGEDQTNAWNADLRERLEQSGVLCFTHQRTPNISTTLLKKLLTK